MIARKSNTTWVVYEMLNRGKPSGVNAVCDQEEWDAMQRLQPGLHPLIQAGIQNEGQAEQIARTTRPPTPVPVAAPAE